MTKASPEPRIRLSREKVLAAAVAIADAQGIEALTMRALGESLGVQAMSLYHHVANKDALLDAMVDVIVAEIALPGAGGDWQAEMRARCASAHAVLMRHPWAAGQLMARVNVGPAMLTYIDATLGCLVAAGFSLEMADQARNVIDSHLYGFTLQALTFPVPEGQYAAMAAQFLPMLPAERFPQMRALAELVAGSRYDGLHHFHFGLELILVALEGLRIRGSSGGIPPGAP